LKWSDGPVNSSNPDVFSPVSGVIIHRGPTRRSVFIREDGTGVVHAIYHLDSYDALVADAQLNVTRIAQGQRIGAMGNTGSGSAPGEGNHVHYEVLLPEFKSDDVGTWNRIDPLVYWTPGLNPYANQLSGTSFDTQKLNRTGLLVTSTAIRDVNNDGVADSQGYLKEGEQAFLSFEINTGHTQAIVLRIRFSGESLKAGQLLFDTGNPNVSVDPFEPNTVYLTLPPTQSQSTPNTSALLGLTYDGFEDLDFASAVLHYTVEAGYWQGSNWYAYNWSSGSNNVFTPVINRTLLVLDNDGPLYTPDPARIVQGSDEPNRNFATPNYYDKDLDGLSGGGRVDLTGTYNGYSGGYRDQRYGGVPSGSFDTIYLGPRNYDEPEQYWGPDADAIYGNGGDDWLAGPGAVSQARVLIDGGAGNDFILASITGDKLPVRSDGTGAPTPGEAGAVTYGGAGHDFVLGQWRDDWIEGGADHDQIFGLAGADRIDGGTGNDWLSGDDMAAQDVVYQGGEVVSGVSVSDFANWNDVVIGGPDVDTGFADDDTLLGGWGDDYLKGGAGNDYLYGDAHGGLGRQQLIMERYPTLDYIGYWTDVWGWVGETRTHYLPLYGLSSDPYATLLITDWAIDYAQIALINESPTAISGDDYLEGGLGQDKLFGGARDDILDGGAGDDKLYGEAGDDQLFGGEGNDELWGDKDPALYDQEMAWRDYNGWRLQDRRHKDGRDVWGNDVLDGGAGNDILRGGAGNDTYLFNRGGGNDTIIETAGRDVIRFGIAILPSQVTPTYDRESGNLTFRLDTGETVTIGSWAMPADRVEYVQFADGTIWDAVTIASRVGLDLSLYDVLAGIGTSDSDTLVTSEGPNTIRPGGGDDVVYADASDEVVVQPGDGIDRIYSEDGAPPVRFVFEGGITPDAITVSQYSASSGRQFLKITHGSGDELHIENGVRDVGQQYQFGTTVLTHSQLLQSLGTFNVDARTDAAVASRDNTLFGGVGDDFMLGGEGRDVLGGQAGNDQLFGGRGSDTILGGEGNDLLQGGDGGAVDGDDRLYGEAGDDTMFGEAGNDYLNGGVGDDELQGNLGDDTLDGAAGADQLYGHDGSDLLRGGDGADELFGGTGSDTLYGGADNDWIQGGDGGATDGADRLFGEAGNDTLLGEAGDDYLSGGDGNDDVVFFGASCVSSAQNTSARQRIVRFRLAPTCCALYAGRNLNRCVSSGGRARSSLGSGARRIRGGQGKEGAGRSGPTAIA
jgi:Ca2+-binding RTX toxin-like protein